MLLTLSLVLAGISGLFWLLSQAEPAHAVETLEFNLTRPGVEPLRIVQFSDLHFYGPEPWHQDLVQAITQARPDILVFTGDLCDNPAILNQADALFDQLPQVPRYAILGNHEYRNHGNLELIQAFYARHGFTLLQNQSAWLDHGGRSLRILGLDDAIKGEAQTELLGMEDYDVVLIHEPGLFDRAAPGPDSRKTRLFLAGHTHGGQIAPGGHALLLPGYSGAYVHGRYARAADTLLVSKGLGTTAIPLRIGASRDIMVVTF